ncbi:hypothetical protein ACTWPB_09990 [Nocardia sp. IBHARD005]|uniref:hypothetical protein n=1 Tax=Nocardia sp. IBHARD005 TaxID=3457765 RepID=UPI004059E4A0
MKMATAMAAFGVQFDDITSTNLDAVYARSSTPAVVTLQVLLKTAPRNKHLARDMEPLLPYLRKISIDDLTAVLTYIMSVSKTPTDELRPLIDQLGPQAKEALVTTAEQLRAEGEAIGEARGRVAMLRELLADQLTLKFGVVPREVIAIVDGAGLEQLREWSANILTAARLDDMNIR